MQTRVGYKTSYISIGSVYIRQQSFCSGHRWEGKWLTNTTLHWNTYCNSNDISLSSSSLQSSRIRNSVPRLPMSPFQLAGRVSCPAPWRIWGITRWVCVTLVRIQPQHWTTTLRLPVFHRLGGLAARGHPDNINNSEPCHHEEQSGGNCRYGDEDVAVEN